MLRQECRVQGVVDGSLSPALYPPPPPHHLQAKTEDGADPYEPILPFERVRIRSVQSKSEGNFFAELDEEEEDSMGRAAIVGLRGGWINRRRTLPLAATQ